MSQPIKVYVIAYKGRKNLMMRYKCPETGKQIARSTETNKAKDAAKVAAVWEAELREGRYQRSSRMMWDEFRELWESSTCKTQRPSTAANYASALNAFEELCRPERVSDLSTTRVSAFAAGLRKGRTRLRKDETKVEYNLSEASIARHLRHLKAVANWAHRNELLPKLPKFDMPRRASGAQRMKGRPITTEEFERMLAATKGIVGEKAAESWQFLLRGLWTTGLRISECVHLRWDYVPGDPCVVIDGKRSVLAFDADAQKSGKVQHVPLAPEAVELLEPVKQRTGYVFHPKLKDGTPLARHALKIGKTISAIGKAAGVVTDPSKGKTATAHDLRRAFGSRWSKLVMPATLKEIMRHADIQTTMTYYVQQSAQITASELWEVRGNTLGNTQPAKRSKRQKTS